MRRWRAWLATAHSSVLIHRTFIAVWVVLWVVAEITGWVDLPSFISRLSLVALILGSWAALEGAHAAERAEGDTGGTCSRCGGVGGY